MEYCETDLSKIIKTNGITPLTQESSPKSRHYDILLRWLKATKASFQITPFTEIWRYPSFNTAIKSIDQGQFYQDIRFRFR